MAESLSGLRPATLLKKKLWYRCFFCEFCETSRNTFSYTVTYPDFFWANRLHLGFSPLPFLHHGWRKFLNLVSPDPLKMHSLAVPVLRFLWKKSSNKNLKNLFWAPEFGPVYRAPKRQGDVTVIEHLRWLLLFIDGAISLRNFGFPKKKKAHC